MPIRFYFDEDSLRRSIIDGLRQHGVDVETSTDAAMGGRLDEEHLVYAAQNGRVLVSFNVGDFFGCPDRSRWAAQGPEKPLV